MLITPQAVSSLLNALGLSSSIFKPIPDLVGTIDGVLNSTGQVVDGVLNGVGLNGLTPLVDNILIAEPSNSKKASPSVLLSKSSNSTNSSCAVEPYDGGPLPDQSFPPFDLAKANVFRYRRQQAVNLGSWFVHEQWMTPSVFTCAAGPQVAEIDIATGWGSPENAQAVLERHWDNFINQTDFEYLSSIGINTVRLPIGYWTLGPAYCQGTPFEPVADVYNNSWSRVVRAINWANDAGIGVLIDLHGAPGSQNGQPHSGISDGQANLFNNATNIELTMNVLTFLVQQLAPVSNVIGVELLNEPNNDPTLSDFYTQAIGTLRELSPEAETLPIYIQDAFDMQDFSEFVGERPDFVVADHHSYFVFTSADDMEPAAGHTADVEGYIADQLQNATTTARGNLIVGEWSCALTPDSLANVTDASVLLVRQAFCQAQEQVYTNSTAGWSFWSYMKEDCSTDLDWCFKNAVNNTLPASFYSYGNPGSMNTQRVQAIELALSNMALPSFTEVLGNASSQPTSDSSTSTGTPSATSQSSSTTDLSRTSATTAASAATEEPSLSPNVAFSPVDSYRATAHGDISFDQRFNAIHNRRYSRSHRKGNRTSTSSNSTSTSTSSAALSASQVAITKGYSDGFMTAKIFAQYNLSKLGFVEQYVSDSIAALGPQVVGPGQETYYTQWFNRGLADGEMLVGEALNF